MDDTPHYRYIRSLGLGASLYSVTPRGIEDFLSAPEASQPGVVVVSIERDGAEREDRILGGPRTGEILRHVGRYGEDLLAALRPLAVIAIEAPPADRGIGLLIGERLRSLSEAAKRRGTEPKAEDGELGRYAGLVRDMTGAIAHVLGVDPFEAPPRLN